jgi:hypothetical protein
MIQADSVHSTPPPNTSALPSDAARGLMASATAELIPDRRIFLARAAGSLVFAATAGTAMGGTVDPIFAAIENHKTVYGKLQEVVSEHSRLESTLPSEKRESNIDAWEEKIVETDDPRWIESERAIRRSFDAEKDAACVLVSICPTTMAGIISLLRYANAVDIDGMSWPDQLESDDGTKTRSWHYFLIEVVAEALPLVTT